MEEEGYLMKLFSKVLSIFSIGTFFASVAFSSAYYPIEYVPLMTLIYTVVGVAWWNFFFEYIWDVFWWLERFDGKSDGKVS